MRARLARGLTVLLVESHLWVALAATGLTLFAQSFLGLPLAWYPAALVFASTMLIYEVDELFDRVRSSSAAHVRRHPWRGLACAGLYAVAVAFCLIAAPASVRYLVGCGAVPCLLYGAPVACFKGARLRALPGVKPFFVTAALTVAAIGVPSMWVVSPPQSGSIALLAMCLFGITLCNVTIFDLRDLDQDAHQSISTIPVILGVTGTRRFCLAVCAGLLCLLVTTSSLAGSSPVIALACAVGATALYCGALPTNSGRLTYAIAVDGVPVLLGLSILS